MFKIGQNQQPIVEKYNVKARNNMDEALKLKF